VKKIGDDIENAAEAITDTVTDYAEDLVNAARDAADKVNDAIADAVSDAKKTASAAEKGVVAAAKDTEKLAEEALKEVLRILESVDFQGIAIDGTLSMRASEPSILGLEVIMSMDGNTHNLSLEMESPPNPTKLVSQLVDEIKKLIV